MAAEVSDFVVRAASRRHNLHVTAMPSAVWLDPMRARHHGALLQCMNPYLGRRQVLECVEALAFPSLPPQPPASAGFVIEAELYPSDQGMVVRLMLFPILQGQQGALLMIREGVISRRGQRKKRETTLAALLDPLLDAAAGRSTQRQPADPTPTTPITTPQPHPSDEPMEAP
jgi:hypothetical protein